MAGRRPWGQLMRILEGLPRHSHYKAALDSDDTVASMALSMRSGDEDEQQPQVPLAGYDPLAMRLDNVFDAVNALAETVKSALSRRNSRVDPVRATRPETAIQRLQRQQTHQHLFDMEYKLTGGR